MSNLFNDTDFKFFKSIVVEAGAIAEDIQKKGVDIRRKSDASIVTHADLTVQKFLINRISKRYSEVNFIYEENFDTSAINIDDETISVIIDPIDGTAMFSMYLPAWCVSIGIFKGYNPVYGFVYSPGFDMLFYNDNENSYLNNIIKRVDRYTKINYETNIFYASEAHRIISIDFPGKVRNLGSTALHACLTIDNARNRIFAFIGKSMLWDWAGAIPIILKAEGYIRYLSGKEVNYREIVMNQYRLNDYLIVYSSDDFKTVQGIFKKI